mgnify:CR=1 FL=1
MDESSSPDKTTIAPDVLVTIARLSALSVPGVSRMANVSGMRPNDEFYALGRG